MKNVRSELLPDHKVFELSDGRKFGAHKHSCLFCNHCSDIYWDYSNGIYAINCDKNWNNEDIRTEHIKSAFSNGKCEFFNESEVEQ